MMNNTKKTSLSRLRYHKLITVATIIALSFMLILYLVIAHESQQTIHFIGKVAVVYALPTYHEEVVSTFSCMLHDMGFKVFVYVGSGVNVLGFTLPYSDVRKKNSERFYGKCVSQWESLSYPEVTSIIQHYVYKPDIMVFITYPMRITPTGLDDYQAVDIIKKLVVEDKSKAPVVLVTHHPYSILKMFNPGDPVHTILPLNQTTFMFLGEHTEKQSKQVLMDEIASFGEAENYNELEVRTNYLYPVMPLEWIPKPDDNNSELRHKPVFAIQGNFGGSHAKKKDPRGVADCLRHIERNYSSDLSIDFIGHLSGQIEVGKLKNGKIRFLSGLDHPHFYAAIANAKFLVFGTTSISYFTDAASSSIPAALITQVPLVTSKDFLALYPCLRDSRIHNYMARDSECDAMMAALTLTDDQYRQAKEEIKNCSSYLWNDAKNKLWSVMK